MSYNSFLSNLVSSNPDDFRDKGLKYSPLLLVGSLVVGEKPVMTLTVVFRFGNNRSSPRNFK